MRGLNAAQAYYDAHPLRRHKKRKRGREYPLNHVSTAGLTYRTKKADPPCAVVEQAVVTRLLLLSANAMRLYCTLCRFANKHTGFAYPTKRKLMHRVGFVPYHTHFVTGAVRVGLTKKQKATRKSQLDRFSSTLDRTIDELLAARLIERGTKSMTQSDGTSIQLDGYHILAADGSRRNLAKLRFRRATFVIQGWLFEVGAFAIRTPNKRSGFEPLSDLCIPVLLLALRDSDPLRFGGIEPTRLQMIDGEVIIPVTGWPSDLPYSIPQLHEAISELLRRKLIRVHSGIFSGSHGQLIDSSARPLDECAGEVRRVAFKFT